MFIYIILAMNNINICASNLLVYIEADLIVNDR
jgi:hypothetical protein